MHVGRLPFWCVERREHPRHHRFAVGGVGGAKRQGPRPLASLGPVRVAQRLHRPNLRGGSPVASRVDHGPPHVVGRQH